MVVETKTLVTTYPGAAPPTSSSKDTHINEEEDEEDIESNESLDIASDMDIDNQLEMREQKEGLRLSEASEHTDEVALAAAQG